LLAFLSRSFPMFEYFSMKSKYIDSSRS